MTTLTIRSEVGVRQRRPTRRACSLLAECVIEVGTSADYKALAAYHYRDTGYPPAVHEVYRARHEPTGRRVGVIVYAAPALNLGIRNKVFGEQYKIGGGKGANDAKAARLNRDLELIIRVVVHPTFRGTGLGRRLIAETLPLRPYRYVEMSAAMGTINPFAARAGMTAITVPRPENTERVLAALRSIGMSDEQMGNPADIVRAVEGLGDGQRGWIEGELTRYATRWIKSRTGRDIRMSLRIAAERVASNALLRTTYYLWENPAFSESGSGSSPARSP